MPRDKIEQGEWIEARRWNVNLARSFAPDRYGDGHGVAIGIADHGKAQGRIGSQHRHHALPAGPGCQVA